MKITKEFTIRFDASPGCPRSKKLKVIITIKDVTVTGTFVVILLDGDKKREVRCNTLEYAVEKYEEINI